MKVSTELAIGEGLGSSASFGVLIGVLLALVLSANWNCPLQIQRSRLPEHREIRSVLRSYYIKFFDRDRHRHIRVRFDTFIPRRHGPECDL